MSDQERPGESKGERVRETDDTTQDRDGTRKFLFGKDQTPEQMAAVLQTEWTRLYGESE